MLSAVAARKARLQAKAPSQPPPPAAEPSPSPSPSPEDVSDHVKPSSKRKSSASTPKPSRKKRKVNKTVEKKSARYFAEKDSFKEQEDIIVVEDDEDDVSSSSGLEEDPAEHIPVPSKPLLAASAKRAWSPSAPLADSSDEEVEDPVLEQVALGAVPTPRPAVQPRQLLSTFRPIPDQNFFHLAEGELEYLGLSCADAAKALLLQASDRLVLLGTYGLTVLQGAVRVNGVELYASSRSHAVFAPRSSPLPVIELAPPRTTPRDLAIPLPSRLAGVVAQAEAIVLLQELRTGVEGLGKVCRTFEDAFLPSRWQKNQMSIDLGLQGVHYVSYDAPEAQPFIMPSTWEKTLESVDSALIEDDEMSSLSRKVYLVQGVKKTGKSTFARTLANRLLRKYKRVAFLECDLGQSEFTPGGLVSLNLLDAPVFGPPFTHPCIPYRAHYLGCTTPRNCPSQYVEAVSALVQAYNMDVQYAGQLEASSDADDRVNDMIPLVVNMMGWTKGLGADLCRKVAEIIEPSAVFDFEAPPSENIWSMNRASDFAEPSGNSFEALSTSIQRYSLEAIPQAVMSQRYSPADQRTLSALSYFHATFPSTSSPSQLRSLYATSWNTALPLCAQEPYELQASTALDAVILSGPGSEDVVPSEVQHVLNGAVVGLYSCEAGALDLDASTQASTSAAHDMPYTQGTSLPPPAASNCHGLALIRSVSADTPATLHLLTPVPPAVLSAARPRVLVKGEMELPVWGMLDFRSEDAVAGVEKAKVPFLRWGKTEGTGGERRRVRRNLMRRGQQ